MHLAKLNKTSCVANDICKDEFAQNHTLLDDGAVHARWKNGSWQITRIGEIWKRTGKVLSVRFNGTDAYPSFQFAEDGTPLPLMEKVLKALPATMSPWQRAYWMALPNAKLEGKRPAKSIKAGDDRVVDVASQAGTKTVH